MIKKTTLNLDALAKNFMQKCRSLEAIRVAVAYPCSADALDGPLEASKMGLIQPILIGPRTQIKELAIQKKLDISHLEIIDVENSEKAADISVSLAREGKVDALMKGSMHTDVLMHAVIKKDGGLRTGRRISHAFIMAIETYPKPFIITDAAININPDLMTKRDIIQNAIDLTQTLKKGIVPKVAVLSAVETINPEIPSTLDAACLSKMAERGQIRGGIVDGPFAYDNVISLHAAQVKHIHSPVVGDADIFVVPNLEAGNMLAKQLIFVTKALSAGLILGASVPIILTSRSDGVQSRIGSCAAAVLMARANRFNLE